MSSRRGIKSGLYAEADEMRRTGEQHGRRWAAEAADFDELAALDDLRGEDVSFFQLRSRFEALAQFVSFCDDRTAALRASETLAFVLAPGFVTGALQVWDLVHASVDG